MGEDKQAFEGEKERFDGGEKEAFEGDVEGHKFVEKAVEKAAEGETDEPDVEGHAFNPQTSEG